MSKAWPKIEEHRRVTAEGDQLTGKEGIDVFSRGKLVTTFPFKHNENFAPEP